MLCGLNEERLKDILARYAGDGITPEHISRDVREALRTVLEGDDERKQCQEKIDHAVGCSRMLGVASMRCGKHYRRWASS
jgi:hypothetical protein